jgi:hypothetical protein
VTAIQTVGAAVPERVRLFNETGDLDLAYSSEGLPRFRVNAVRQRVFFDGSVRVDNNATNTYVGQGTLYLSGKFTFANGSQLCGAVSGGSCNFTSWDPNSTMLADVADGPGDSVVLENSAKFQGALYGTNTVYIQNSAQPDGPLVAGTFILENNIHLNEFPTITSVPIGMPGNPNVYAQPLPPGQFSG